MIRVEETARRSGSAEWADAMVEIKEVRSVKKEGEGKEQMKLVKLKKRK